MINDYAFKVISHYLTDTNLLMTIIYNYYYLSDEEISNSFNTPVVFVGTNCDTSITHNNMT